MIGYLKGKIIDQELKWVILDVNGVGYKIWTNTTSISKNGEMSEFFTYLAVRENSLDLYGFRTKKELSFFELLLTVSGIGPKSAMTILSVASVSTLSRAIQTNDSASLIKVSGIGRKNAEKIVLELQDKADGFDDGSYANKKDDGDAMDALVSLGYSERQVRDVLKKISAENTEDQIKMALKELSARH